MTCPAAPNAAERLILAGVRAWAMARMSREAPQEPVHRAVGSVTSDAAATLFVGWMEALERNASRALSLGCGQCGGLSMDEQRLITACGIAPIDLDTGQKLLEPLQIDPGPAMIMARALNAALAAIGLPLPARFDTDEFAHERTIH